MSTRLAVIAYGAFAYLTFFAVFLYTIGFLGGIAVPKGVDDGASGSVVLALVVNLVLLSLFAVQHSVMARPWFKQAWTRIVPTSVERSTYVLASNAVIALLLWQWRPITDQVWSVGPDWARVLLWGLYAAGWAILVVSTFMIGHFDLFGLRQVLARWRSEAYAEPGFKQPGFYRLVRHPMMVGFVIAFWAAPDMSAGRLLFAAVATGYIIVAVQIEERDLRAQLGERYQRYADEVPQLMPRPSVRRSSANPDEAASWN